MSAGDFVWRCAWHKFNKSWQLRGASYPDDPLGLIAPGITMVRVIKRKHGVKQVNYVFAPMRGVSQAGPMEWEEAQALAVATLRVSGYRLEMQP